MYKHQNQQLRCLLKPFVPFLLFILLGLIVIISKPALAASYSASGVLGNSNFTGSYPNGGPNSSGLYYPRYTAIDQVNHRLFVSDWENERVLVYQLDSNGNLTTTTPAYVLGEISFTNATGGCAQGLMWQPEGLAYDPVNSRLFVADTGNARVLVFNVATSTISNGENASYVLGQVNFTSRSGALSQSGMASPYGLAYDQNDSRLFVADSYYNRVLVFNVATSTISNNENASYVLGQSSFTTDVATTTQSGLNAPLTVSYDPTFSRLFVADYGNNRVLVFNAATSTISNNENASYVLGQTGFTNNGSATTQSGLRNPRDLAYDSINARLFVSDSPNNRVLVFNVATSTISNGENASYVLGQVNFVAAASAASQSGMTSPIGLAYDSTTSRLFVVDTNNSRVLAFNVSTSTIADGENASGLIGQYDDNGSASYIKNGPNNGPSSAGFYSPSGSVVDPANHRLFVSDSSNNRVLVFQLDSNDNISTTTPIYILGQSSFSTGTATTTRSGMNTPYGLAYDSANSLLFVADEGNNRILVFNVATSTVSDGENASYVLGQTGFTNNGSATTQSGLYEPYGLAYDSVNSRLFVADYGNNRVLVFNAATSTISNGENASYVLGQTGFTTRTITTSQSGLYESSGLSYDSASSQLFVADRGNNRVLVFNAATSTITNDESANFVIGQSNFTTNTGVTSAPGLAYSSGASATQTGLDYPLRVVYDPTYSRLFVTDNGNNRLLEYKVVNILPLPTATTFTNLFFSQTITSTSSQGTASLSLSPGSTPLTLSGTTLSGTSTVAGAYNFSLTAADNNGTIGTITSDPQSFTLYVLNPPSSGTTSTVVMSDSTSTITLSDASSSAALTPGLTATSTINVPSTVTTPTLNVSLLTSTTTTSTVSTISNPVVINATTTQISVNVQLPASTTITVASSSWNGILNLPTSYINSITITPPSGYTSPAQSAAIELGVSNTATTFSQAVRLSLAGEAGKFVGYIDNSGKFENISTKCSGDSQTNGNTLVEGGDCYINSGSDLIVWTKHFTPFVTYTAQVAVSGASVAVGGGPNVSQFSNILLNAPSVSSSSITFFASADNTSQISFFWFAVDGHKVENTLSAPPYSLTLPLSYFASGPHFLQAFADDDYGDIAQSERIAFTVGGAATSSAVTTGTAAVQFAAHPFLSYLQFGSQGAEVAKLQRVLFDLGVYPQDLVTGYFGPLTRKAVEKLQLECGLPAVGSFNSLTMASVNSLIVLSTSTPAIFVRNLTVGDKGRDVAALQGFLITKDAGHSAVVLSGYGTTGYFGPITENALAEYQKSVGIGLASGYFGPVTRKWMAENY
ncbi:MAG: peptidoglycan-binding protein [Patescibacteria group bacterium]|nr:peptidoglycan-binding protein [Patescibacteria group bacterium]